MIDIIRARSREDLAGANFSRCGLPFLRPFLENLIDWERLEGDRRIRAYQLELIRSGTLEVSSPFTGVGISVTHSLILRNHMVFYGFADVAPVFMIASTLGSGYPITGALFPKNRLLVQIGQSIEWGPQQQHIDMLATALEIQRGPDAIGKATPIIVTGDQNFAHCAWNQLGGMETLVSSGLIDRAGEVIVTSEPLGRLDELFPEIESRRLRRLRHRDLEHFNTGDSLFVPVGGVRLPKSVRNRVMAFAAKKLSPRGMQIQGEIIDRRDLPTFWISVRTRNRTAVNQVSLISDTIRGLLSNFGACNILLDGHSLSMDYENNPDIDRGSATEIVRADQGEVEKILTAVGDSIRLFPGTTVVEAVGLPILDSIFLGQFADFYVCHHGSVQHKIGWFHPVPGAVHTNKAYLEHPPSRWVASQSDCAVEPKYVNSAWITDLDRPDTYRHYPEHMPLQNYRVDDIPAVVSFVVEHAREALRSR